MKKISTTEFCMNMESLNLGSVFLCFQSVKKNTQCWLILISSLFFHSMKLKLQLRIIAIFTLMKNFCDHWKWLIFFPSKCHHPAPSPQQLRVCWTHLAYSVLERNRISKQLRLSASPWKRAKLSNIIPLYLSPYWCV